MKKEINSLDVFFNFINFIFIGNTLFLISNLPLVISYIIIGEDFFKNIGLIQYILFIPLGPAFCALLKLSLNFIKDGDIPIFKFYIRGYKTNFIQSTFLWIIIETILFISIYNIKYYYSKNGFSILVSLILAVFIWTVLSFLYMFPILSRFYIKSIDLIKISFSYSLIKLKTTLLIISLIIFSILIFLLINKYSLFFIFSLFSLLIMVYEKNLITEFEPNIK